MWFSLGNLYGWGDYDTLFSYVKDLPIDGLEIVFGRAFELLSFSPDTEQIALLRKKGVGIHAPMVSRFGCDTKGVNTALSRLVKQLSPRYVVFHPTDLLPDLEGIPVAVENLSPRWKIDLDSFKRYAGKHNVVLDVSHAVQWGPDEIKKYVEEFYDRIVAVHFTYMHKDKDFRKYDWFFDAIRPLKWLTVPIVFERPLSQGTDIKKEIEICRSIMDSI